MLNPITKNRKHLIAYFLFWLLVSILQTMVIHWTKGIDWLPAFIESFIYGVGFGVVGLSIWFVVRFTGLEFSNLWNALMNHIGAASILIFIWVAVCYTINAAITRSPYNLFSMSMSEIGWRLALGFVYYLVVALNYYLLIFYQNYKEKELAELEVKALLKESELSMLKAQLNPHFIFNSLNSISALTLTRPEDAHEMIVKLSTFLRHTIGHSETELVTIQKEIETITLYLDIEKSRFGDRLQVEIYGLETLDKEVKVPNLILQPLVENAIKYGVYENIETSLVQISLAINDPFLEVTIVNNCEKTPAKKGKGIGLKNVKGRLSYLYERNDLLSTHETNDQFQVTLKIPQQG